MTRSAVLNFGQRTVLERLQLSRGSAFDSHDNEDDSKCLLGTRREHFEEFGHRANGQLAASFCFMRRVGDHGAARKLEISLKLARSEYQMRSRALTISLLAV